MTQSNPEQQRLVEARDPRTPWKKWGPYLSERQWGTVREDYSPNGDAWNYFTHDRARSRAYHWGEDGLGGISDDHQVLCFALALWNGKDPILKERLFGLANNEGNHGEDVKEYYFYLDSTPTHSYLKYLYKYPQAAYPYGDLVATNRARGQHEAEYELLDTGVFADDRYFDVFVECAKAAPEDVLIRITVCNRGPEAAPLHVLPTLWFRNTWSWAGGGSKPVLKTITVEGRAVVHAHHTDPLFQDFLGDYFLYGDAAAPLTRRSRRPPCGRTRTAPTSCARRWRGCCGPSSTSTTIWTNGWKNTAPIPARRRPSAGARATANGSTCSTTTSSRCRTSGSTPGTPPGIWPST